MKNLGKKVFVCPGQGGQKVGMINHLRSVAAYDEVMKIAKIALEPESNDDPIQGTQGSYSTNIEKLMVEGPAEELGMTENTCPAMLIMSYLEYWRYKENYRKDVTTFQYGLGHSLGEVIAATIAGSFSLYDAIKLAKDRAIIMQKNWPPNIGRMIVITADSEYVDKLINEFKNIYCESKDNSSDVLTISSMNSYNSTTISGTTDIVNSFIKYCNNLSSQKKIDKAFGILDLPVSVAGHCELMTQAQIEYADLLSTIEIKDPIVPIISWIDWTPKYTNIELRQSLIDSYCLPVNFKGLIHFCINQNVDDYVEFSSRGSMTRLIKNIQMNYTKPQ